MKKRHYTEAETRAHVAGMQAHREGRDFKEAMSAIPRELRWAWVCGWKRVGNRPKNLLVDQKDRLLDHTTRSHGSHVIRTQVETLEQALTVIATQRRATKAAATRFQQTGGHVDLKKEFHLLRARQASPLSRQPVSLPKVSILEPLPVPMSNVGAPSIQLRLEHAIGTIVASVEETRARMREAVHSLTIGVNEIMSVRTKDMSGINLKPLVDLVIGLARSVGLPPPEFTYARSLTLQAEPKNLTCKSCGTIFKTQDRRRQRCDDCIKSDPVKRDSEQRRRTAEAISELEREARLLRKVIDQVEASL